MKIDARTDPSLTRQFQVVDRRDCSEIRDCIAADEETCVVVIRRKGFAGDTAETIHFPEGIRINPRPHR